MWDFMAHDGHVLMIYNLLWFQGGTLGVSVFRYKICVTMENHLSFLTIDLSPCSTPNPKFKSFVSVHFKLVGG